jgi:hypothetical protein
MKRHIISNHPCHYIIEEVSINEEIVFPAIIINMFDFNHFSARFGCEFILKTITVLLLSSYPASFHHPEIFLLLFYLSIQA